jgi:hypothetical protein
MRTLLCALALCAACGGPLQTDASNESGEWTRDGATADLVGNFEPEDPLPGAGDLRGSYNFTVKSGHHHSNHDFIAKPHLGHNVNRALSFTATFAGNASYTTQNPGNQSDWNKLMGLSTDRIHKNSIRIGWAWNPSLQRVDLAFYGYLDGRRVSQKLTDVALGQPVNCSLQMTNNGLTATADGHSYNLAGSLGASFPLTWVLHSVYFGGDETAPHDIQVSVQNIQAQ